MSGPIQPSDALWEDDAISGVELREGRRASIGPSEVVRVLPTKGRRTVGPWCFADLIIPSDFDDPVPLEIGPHPHIGLATVTWLFEGEVLHGDSLGTEQLIRPGQLNLMTAGHGIAHSEEGKSPTVRGVQLWLAQPEAHRHGGSRFQHVEAIPEVDVENATARLLIGSAAGATSPAVVDHPTVAIELHARRGRCSLALDPLFEYAVIPVDRSVLVGGAVTEPGWTAILPTGTEALPIESDGSGTMMVLGGLPLGTGIQMWWNFVARTLGEIEEAWRDWESENLDRFGSVPTNMARVEAPRPHWL